MYVHSIPNNNDNQDVVSMGTNAALMTAKVIDNCFQVMAIECIALIQGVEYLNCSEQMSSIGRAFTDELKKIVPPFKEDGSHTEAIMNLADHLKNNPPPIKLN
jgi:histidine ammonia-lyase